MGDDDTLKPSVIDSLDLVANSLSLLACIFLLVRVRFIDARLRQRLFLRQMVAMATADLLYHLKHILHYVDAPLQVDPVNEGVFLCTFYRISGRCFLAASATVTAHIGLTFAFQSMRKMRALELMSKSIPVCWVLAALIGLEDIIVNGLSDVRWCPEDKAGPDEGRVSYPYGVTLILAGVVGLVATFLTAHASRGCSDATVKRLMRQVGSLPISCLLTQLPTGLLALNIPTNDTFIEFARFCKYMNGFANVLAYALQSRYTPHLMGWAASRAKHDFLKCNGYITQGGDLLREVMTVEAAKKKALELEGCQGFCFKDSESEEVEVVFKSKWDVKQGANPWTAYQLVRYTELKDELRAQPKQAAIHSFHPCFGPGDHVQVEVFLIPDRIDRLAMALRPPPSTGKTACGPPPSNCKTAFGPPETDMPDVPLDFAF